MKKIAALILAGMMVMSMAACGSKQTSKTADSDLEYVKEKGTLIVGMTDFAPMDYQEDGEWVGFDADNAKAFAEKLGVECQFIEINWDSKINELNSKSVDCLWNGMTITDEVKNAMEPSNPYCKNGQIIVVKSDVADQYQIADDCKDLKFAVESGSAGEDAAAECGFDYITVTTQADALMEVSAGTSDACIIDLLMAGAMVGKGTSYEDMTTTALLTEEDYGVGFRKGSDLAKALNEFFVEIYKDGSLTERANQYGVQDSLIEQK